MSDCGATWNPPLSRRAVLGYGGLGGGLAIIEGSPLLRPVLSAILSASPATFTAMLRRREDQLWLRFEFFNLFLDTSNPAAPVLRRVAPRASYIAVVFPAQHVLEQAFLEASEQCSDDPPECIDDSEPVPPPPIPTRVAGESRLVFSVPASALPLPYDTATLLDWARFPMSVVPNAQPRFVPRPPPPLVGAPTAPGAVATALELPWRLVISPHTQAGWAHATAPVTSDDGRTELWHTRLGSRKITNAGWVVDESDDDQRTIRAVWALDPGFDPEQEPPELDEPFRASLNERARFDLVRLSSDFDLTNYEPQPIDVDRLMLSSLGSWLDCQGVFDPPAALSSLREWRHRATLGRDHFVRVVRAGCLLPFGHPASLIKVTERKFARPGPLGLGRRGAYLRQRVFVVVRRPGMSYVPTPGNPLGIPDEGRRLPFRSVRLRTIVSPNLDPAEPFIDGGDLKVFAIFVGGEPFPFLMTGTDWAGREIDFTCPLVWVDGTLCHDPEHTKPIVEAYNEVDVDDELRRRDFGGRKVTLAASERPGDTAVQVDTLNLGAALPGNPNADFAGAGQPAFYPVLAQAAVRFAEAAALAGNEAAPAFVEYADAYLTAGFEGGNAGQVFLTTTGATTSPLNFGTDRSGGLATPNLAVSGYSRRLGPVAGGPATVAGGSFDPEQVFAAAEAKILGGIDLLAILHSADVLANPERALKLTSVERDDPRRVETTLDWHPELKVGGPGGLDVFEPIDLFGFDMRATVVTHLDDPELSTFSIHGDLRDFRVHLFGTGATEFVRVKVDQLQFTAAKDQKSDVECRVGDVSFHGALEFVAALAELASFGDGSGISIDVTDDAIAIALEIELPSLSFGVFGLRNIAILAGLVIPFDGSPVRFRFAFCSREDQFILSVLIFGGGGFVGLELGADGVELLEFAFEFGATFSLDIGVASGAVEAMGGIYFKVETIEQGGQEIQQCTLTAYLRMGGEVDVLGLVSVSIEFYLALTYVGPPGVLYGEASVEVEVEVAFFSGSVTLTVRKEIAGGGGGAAGLTGGGFGEARPLAAGQALGGSYSFEDLYEVVDDWERYCDAFAPIGA